MSNISDISILPLADKNSYVLSFEKVFPNELILQVFSHLNSLDLQKVFVVCKHWSLFSAEKALFSTIQELKAFGSFIIQALKGPKAFLELPIITFKGTPKNLYIAGAIKLKDASHPIMRGIYLDGSPILTLKYVTESDIHSSKKSLLYLFRQFPEEKSSFYKDVPYWVSGIGDKWSLAPRLLLSYDIHEVKKDTYDRVSEALIQFLAGKTLMENITYQELCKFTLLKDS